MWDFFFSNCSGSFLSFRFSLQNLIHWLWFHHEKKKNTKSFYWICGQRKLKGISILFFQLPSHIPSVFVVLISKPKRFLTFEVELVNGQQNCKITNKITNKILKDLVRPKHEGNIFYSCLVWAKLIKRSELLYRVSSESQQLWNYTKLNLVP